MVVMVMVVVMMAVPVVAVVVAEKTVHRWIQTAHYQAELLQQALSVTGVCSAMDSDHLKKMGKDRLMRDEQDVKSIIR